MKKLAIVGSHPETRGNAPWDDSGYEIWVLNEAPQAEWCRRWDACFQMHRDEVYTSPNNFIRTDHWAWLQQSHGGRTIWMQTEDARVPGARRYPLEEIMEQIPGAEEGWFESSPAYALALAMFLGFEDVALYGLDMHSDTEYGYQLRNYQYWVGVLRGAGIKVDNQCNFRYFQGRRYGYEGEIQVERGFFAERAGRYEAEYKQADWTLRKAQTRLERALSAGKGQATNELIKEYIDAAIDAGRASGKLAAAEKYAGREDLIPRQEFERGMAQAERDNRDWNDKHMHAGGKAEYVWNVWIQTGNPEARKQLSSFLGEQAMLAFNAGAQAGLYAEHLEYLHELDGRITAAGGQRTVRVLAPRPGPSEVKGR